MDDRPPTTLNNIITDQMIADTRKSLERRKAEIRTRRHKIDDELQQVERDLYALDVFVQARKHGPATEPKRRQRARRGKREIIMEEVRKHPQGITRRQLLETMGMTDKQGAQFVSNALSHFKRQGQLRLENGRYTAA